MRKPLQQLGQLLDDYIVAKYIDIPFGIFLQQQKEAVEFLAKSPEVFGGTE